MQVTSTDLFRLGGYCAVVGGLFRIIMAFIPYTANSVPFEIIYAFIDAVLLLGLLALYFKFSPQLGLSGLVAFVLALLGLASILGPDGTFHGIDTYQAGVFFLLLGLSLLSVLLIHLGALTTAPYLWIATFVLALMALILSAPVLIVVSGVLFGIAFVIAGIEIAGMSAEDAGASLRGA